MKILAAGCLHNNAELIESLAKKAEEKDVDLVVLAGDLTLSEASTEGIVGPFKKRNREVALIHGNHETTATAEFLARKYDASNLHGYGMRCGEVGLFGCGGANVGIHQLTESEIFGYLERSHNYVQDLKKKVMVTHVHPAESAMERFSDFVKGSMGVTQAIEKFKPDLLLCSHVHEASGLEETLGSTRVLNVAKTGKIIEL